MPAMFYRIPTYLLLGFLLGPLAAFAQGFNEVAIESGISFGYEAVSDIGGGLAWFDFNNDGLQDLYLCGGQQEDRLYQNMGGNLFLDASNTANLFETSIRNTIGVVTGDINNDGYPEIFVSTRNAGFSTTLQRDLLYYNNGDGTFYEMGIPAGLDQLKFASAATFVDINADGLLDLYAGSYIDQASLLYDQTGGVVGFAHTCFEDDLWINNGDLTFTAAGNDYWPGNNGCTLAVHATDFDRNGTTDLLANNDFGEWVTPNKLLSLDATGAAVEDVAPSMNAALEIYGMGISAADYDRDMDLDYYFTNLGANTFLRNDGPAGFTDVTADAGVACESFPEGLAVSWGTCFLDFDNNGFSDLFVANGYISAVSWLSNHFEQPNSMFRNNADGTFTDVSTDMLPTNLWRSRGAATCDTNNDGRMDFGVSSVFSGVDAQPAHFGLYRNTWSGGNYLALDLEGVVCNRDAFGTQVEVHTPSGNHLAEVTCGTSHLSQSSKVLHFGLGEETTVDSISVFWPQGPLQVVTDLSINTLHTILQDTTTVLPQDTTDTEEEYINWIISLPAGEGVERIGVKKSAEWQSPVHVLERASIYPQPATNQLAVRFESEEHLPVQLEIWDTSGRLVHTLWSGELHPGSQDLVFHRPMHLSEGVYLLHMQSGGYTTTHRITLAAW